MFQMNQAMSNQIINKDLCISCVFAEYYIHKYYKTYGMTRYIKDIELGKLCHSKRLKKAFNKNLEGQYHHVERIVRKCGLFSNVDLFGNIPKPPNNLKETLDKMPKIGANIFKTLPDIEEGKRYLIKSANVVETQREKYKGVRVGLAEVDNKNELMKDLEANDDGETNSTMLWIQDAVGTKTKLGSFMVGLGSEEEPEQDTDKWVNRHIEVIAWRRANREIKVVD